MPPNVSHHCQEAVRAFVKYYLRLGCEPVYHFNLDQADLLNECRDGAESIRVVYSKLKMVNEALATDVRVRAGPCTA